MNYTLDLLPIERKDLLQLLKWRNDYRIWQYTRQNDMINEIEHVEWFERQAKDKSIRMYKIQVTTPDTTAMVGVCGLTSIDYANSRAEFSCYVDPTAQKAGLGTKALELLFRHGFTNFGLRLIWGESFDGNPAIRIFEKMGMVKEGTRRGFYWKNGKYVDAHLYSITAEEFNAIRNSICDDGKPGFDSVCPVVASAADRNADIPEGAAIS